jgi:hypothetical protein
MESKPEFSLYSTSRRLKSEYKQMTWCNSNKYQVIDIKNSKVQISSFVYCLFLLVALTSSSLLASEGVFLEHEFLGHLIPYWQHFWNHSNITTSDKKMGSSIINQLRLESTLFYQVHNSPFELNFIQTLLAAVECRFKVNIELCINCDQLDTIQASTIDGIIYKYSCIMFILQINY